MIDRSDPAISFPYHYRVADRTGWKAGEWDTEDDWLAWIDEATGYRCCAIRNWHVGAWNGYVQMPSDHPKIGLPIEEFDFKAHGGITYAKGPWIGFDCAHVEKDYYPGSIWPQLETQDYRTLEFVKSECTSLAAQIRDAADAG